MPLIQLILALVVVGVVLWLINNYIPMDATIKKILKASHARMMPIPVG